MVVGRRLLRPPCDYGMTKKQLLRAGLHLQVHFNLYYVLLPQITHQQPKYTVWKHSVSAVCIKDTFLNNIYVFILFN